MEDKTLSTMGKYLLEQFAGAIREEALDDTINGDLTVWEEIGEALKFVGHKEAYWHIWKLRMIAEGTGICEGCEEAEAVDDGLGLCEDCEIEGRIDDREEDYMIDGVGFQDPGGNSALRAATPSNPRIYPCGNCKAPDRLTAIDKQRGYQCDACANRAERGQFFPEGY